MGLRAPRPAASALSSERGMLLPSFDDALARYLVDREAVQAKTETGTAGFAKSKEA